MTIDATDPASATPARRWWEGWRGALALTLTILALRILYLALLCPYDLIEDEAHYWEWSRRLDLSYVTKGPGVAWIIAASTAVLGVSEWAVRLPAALSIAIGALAAGGLAADAARDRRCAFYGALAFHLPPTHVALAQLMTIDGPYLACWTLGAWAAWRALTRASGAALCAFALALGAGFLVKYTIALLPLGVAIAALTMRPALRLPRPRWWPIALAALALAVSPVFIWNAREGWPTVHHLMDHLDAGAAPDGGRSWSPLWTLELLATQLGAMGFTLALMAVALRRARRRTDPAQRAATRYLALAGAPVLAFYLALSLTTQVEGNWPLAGWATLLALVGREAPDALRDYAARVRAWRDAGASRREGWLRRKPETAFQIAWHWSIGCALVVALAMSRADLLATLPVLRDVIPMRRLAGAHERAQKLHDFILEYEAELGQTPMIITNHYGYTSQMAFYLPGRPVVRCARWMIGGSPSQYDFFEDTRLDDPALLGRDAVLLGADEAAWAPAFQEVRRVGSADFALDKPLDGGGSRRPVFFARGYHGWPARTHE